MTTSSEYNRRVLTTVVLTLVLLIAFAGALFFAIRENPSWTVFFIAIFAGSAFELANFYERAWYNP